MARTGGSGASGISAFAVPADAEGITFGRKEVKLGWNSQPTRGITFAGVQVPADHLLGAEGDGFKIAMRGLDGGPHQHRRVLNRCCSGCIERSAELHE